MKKFLLVAFVALMASTNAKAQSHLYETTDEVSIAYGAGSCLQIIDDILTVFTLPSQGDLPNPGTEPGLLHCRQMLYHLSYQGSLGNITYKQLP